MKHFMFLLLFMLPASKISFSQEHNIHPVKYIFDPKANAKEELNTAIAAAGKAHKHILILVGGDWSVASRELDSTLKKDYVLKTLADGFVFMRLNFSPSNKNEAIREQLQCPKYKGYPLLVVLDENGKTLLAQTADEFRSPTHGYIAAKVEKSLRAWAMLPK